MAWTDWDELEKVTKKIIEMIKNTKWEEMTAADQLYKLYKILGIIYVKATGWWPVFYEILPIVDGLAVSLESTRKIIHYFADKAIEACKKGNIQEALDHIERVKREADTLG